jgi:hypothetical protein
MEKRAPPGRLTKGILALAIVPSERALKERNIAMSKAVRFVSMRCSRAKRQRRVHKERAAHPAVAAGEPVGR